MKTKKQICKAVCAAALMLLLGIAGGMERFSISLGAGAALSAVCILVGVFAAWKAGVWR